MSTMRVIAQAGDVRVVQDMNGNIVIEKAPGVYVASADSAYEAIRDLDVSQETRASLLKQWGDDMLSLEKAEKNSREAEYGAY